MVLATVKKSAEHGFPNFVNCRTSQCVFQILREYQNIKIVKSKCKSEEGNKSK